MAFLFLASLSPLFSAVSLSVTLLFCEQQQKIPKSKQKLESLPRPVLGVIIKFANLDR